MDTLSFEPERFHSPQSRRDEAASRIGENLSDVEVFMLRGRRLQAQALGGALRRAFGKLRCLLRGGRHAAGSSRPARRQRPA